VVRAAIGYVVLVWLLAQVADVVLPYVGIVDQPVRWTIIIGIALFPLVLIIAWFFEHPWHNFTGRKVFTDAAIILLIAAVASTWVWRNFPREVFQRTSVAVLPFRHAEQDAVAQTVSRALAYEVIGLLMRSRSIDVLGYESANSPLLDGLDAAAAAARLNVEHVLSGTVRMNGEVMQIRATLSDRAGQVLWQENLDENVDDLFRAEEEIAGGITGRLGGGENLISIDTLAARRCEMPTDPDALERYYTARHYLELRNSINVEHLRESIALFESVISDYPDFAEAMSGLAWALHSQELYDPDVQWGDNEARKLELAQNAFDLCGQLGEAMVFLPNEFDHPNQWISADRQFRAAMEMQPDKSEMADKYVRLMRDVGRLQEALDVSRRNYELNPFSVRSILAYASVLQSLDRFDQAEALQMEAAELGSQLPIFARTMRQMKTCSVDLECRLENLPPPMQAFREQFRLIYTIPESEQQAQQALDTADQLLQQAPFLINWFKSSACHFDHLTPLFFSAWRRVEHPTDWYWPSTWDSRCGNVWSRPEFKQLVQEQGMVEYWHEIAWADYCRPSGDSFECTEPAAE